MSEETRLQLPHSLIEKIDENRRGLTHEEFIDLCVDAWTQYDQSAVEKPPEQAYVTRERFEEFKRGRRNLLRSFTEFVLLSWLELSCLADENDTPLTERVFPSPAQDS